MLDETEKTEFAAEILHETWYRTNGRVTRLAPAACLRIIDTTACGDDHIESPFDRRPSRAHLATCWNAWHAYIDPEDLGGREAFDAMTVEERYEFVIEMDLCKVTN